MRMRSTVAVLVLGLAIGWIANSLWSGRSVNTHSVAIPQMHRATKSNADADLTARQLAEAALALEENGNTQKALYLQEVAMSRAREKPKELSGIWSLLKEHTETESSQKTNNSARLYVFLQELEEVLLKTSDMATFEELWAIREEVSSRLKASSIESVPIKLEQLKQFAKEFEQNSFFEYQDLLSGSQSDEVTKTSFTDLLNAMIGQDETFSASIHSVSEDIGGGEILSEIFSTIIQKAGEEIVGIESEYDIEVGKDRQGEIVEPSNGGSLGRYGILMQRVMDFNNVWQGYDIDYYLSYLRGEKTSSLQTLMNEIDEQAQNLLTHCAEMQHVRYNLWALNRLFVSERTPGNGSRFGQIDVQLLQPAVSTMYSIVYDKLLAEQKDPSARRIFINQLLNEPKVSMERF